MSDTIDIQEVRVRRQRYRRSVHDAARMLRDFQTRLYDATVGVAMAGRLGVELADREVGAIVRIDTDLLHSIGDERVDALVQLDQAIDAVVTALYSKQMAK